MFGNLVNAQDLVYLIRAIRSGRVIQIVRRLLGGRARTVQSTWAHVETPPIRFWDIPTVHRRTTRLITGDADLDYIQYLAEKHFAGREALIGFSLGCGAGLKELTWASHVPFARLDACDISPQRVAAAQANAHERSITSVHFHVGDVYAMQWPAQHYDVVFSDQSMHHMTPLEPLCANIRRTLKPHGYLILSEYVGPSRFQWTDRQLEAVNAVLNLLPERYRVSWEDRSIKRRVHRPSRLRMMLSDPSEAVESAKIIPTLERHFDIVERRDYGGTLIHPLFADIAANFQGNDENTQRLLDLCFQIEDDLLAHGELSSDFTLMVCQPKLKVS
jgi:SAM-dependent methyltransferase